jgi:hypothetical protein
MASEAAMISSIESGTARSSRRLRVYVIIIATAVFVVVPLAINPAAAILFALEGIYPIKFKLLVALSAVLIVAVVGASLSGAKPLRVPVLIPALAFTGISTVSTLLSGKIVHCLIGEEMRYDGLLSLACGVLLFYALARFLESWAAVRTVLAVAVCAAVIISVYGILQTFDLDPFTRWDISWPTVDPATTHVLPPQIETGRATSTIGYPISLAAYLTLMTGAALALYFKTDARWERGIWLAAVALMGACWLYTYTRGAMLGCVLAVPIVAFLAYRRLGSVRPLLLPLAAILVGIIFAHLLNPQSMDIFGRIGQTNLAPTLEEIPEGGDLSVTTRLLMWRDTIPVIAERPLLGHGPDNFIEPFKKHEGADLRAFDPGRAVDKAHNEFLQVAATTGLLGLAAYLWIFVSYFRNAYRSGGWPLLALSGGVLAYILQLQTWVTTLNTGVTFWAILGVSVAIMQIQSRAKEDNRSAHGSGMPGAYAENARG